MRDAVRPAPVLQPEGLVVARAAAYRYPMPAVLIGRAVGPHVPPALGKGAVGARLLLGVEYAQHRV